MYNRYIFKPSGILGFIIYQNSWSEYAMYETEKVPLETKIKDIFKKFFEAAEKLKQREIEFAERKRR